eukprot:11926293-Alexandrium_andersonii.AAC.1
MLAMRGHGPRVVAWRVLGATPSVSRADQPGSRSSEHLLIQYRCRAFVPETGGARLGSFTVLGAFLGPAQRRARL